MILQSNCMILAKLYYIETKYNKQKIIFVAFSLNLIILYVRKMMQRKFNFII